MSVLELLKQGRVSEIDLGEEKRLKIAEDLTEFPREILDIAEEIEILDLSGNSFSDLPADFGRFKNLKILFFADNQFEHVPEIIAECSKLEMLGFKNNKIKIVSEDAIPSNVHWLILTGNEIERLPESFGRLSKLRKLALAGNKIKALPESMKNCQELELVRLSANQLDHVPDWLLQLPKLSWLALSGNPITSVEESESKELFDAVHINELQLKEKIGEGASGHIYRGGSSDSLSKNDIAVKLFKGSITSDGYPDDEIYCCLKAGRHENLIPILAKINDDSNNGLAMELIPNEYANLGLPPSLNTCTRDTFSNDTRLSVQNIIEVLRQMTDVISHMHQRQVSHGDIYAHNTMINQSHHVLFGDFGAATDLSQLSDLQREAVAQIEMRALGCMLDDLLTLIEEQCDIHQKLSQVAEQCMQPNLLERFKFAELLEELTTLAGYASNEKISAS